MKNLILLLAITSGLVFSCGTYDNDQLLDMTSTEEPPPTDQPVRDDRKIIKNGTLAFETHDAESTRVKVVSTAMHFQAYVAHENHSLDDWRINHSITFRVPSANFDSLVSAISLIADTVENRDISTEDVTSEFLDLQSRINNKKVLEQRFNGFLANAATLDDVLRLENEVAAIRQEIETMEGRLRLLSDQSTFSTLTVNYHQVTSIPPVTPSFGHRMSGAFLSGWAGIKNVVVDLTYAWPALLLIVLMGATVYAFRKRVRKAAKVPV